MTARKTRTPRTPPQKLWEMFCAGWDIGARRGKLSMAMAKEEAFRQFVKANDANDSTRGARS